MSMQQLISYPCNKSPEFKLSSCMDNPCNNYLRTICCMAYPCNKSPESRLNSCMGNPCNKFRGLFANYLLHELPMQQLLTIFQIYLLHGLPMQQLMNFWTVTFLYIFDLSPQIDSILIFFTSYLILFKFRRKFDLSFQI